MTVESPGFSQHSHTYYLIFTTLRNRQNHCMQTTKAYRKESSVRGKGRAEGPQLEAQGSPLACPARCTDSSSKATLWVKAQHEGALTLPCIVQKHPCIELVMPSSHLILCRPLLLLPPIPPSIRVFSNKSTLHLRWPKCWSFSFSIGHPNSRCYIQTHGATC